MREWGNGKMREWGNGEMGEWGNGKVRIVRRAILFVTGHQSLVTGH